MNMALSLGYGLGSLDVSLKLVDDHQFPPCQIQGEKMKKYQLQDVSILKNIFYGMTKISSCLLKLVAKK